MVLDDSLSMEAQVTVVGRSVFFDWSGNWSHTSLLTI